VRPTAERQTPQPEFSVEHLSWCADRYRSFDPATNSYLSYSGAPGCRLCIHFRANAFIGPGDDPLERRSALAGLAAIG
ncbi:BA14K family protein, partial [Rhizobium johnstonii]|uniref:BA14K family protein n=1 Tax=Rhizobium johnstonii TaxID=3019933 RepID=UPI003F9D0B20